MDYRSQDAVTVIGEASDFKIVWLEDFTILNEIESLFAKVIIASGYLGKDALLGVLEPKVCHCLDRCDISIQSVSELIEAFTFVDATIFHNRQMHASLYQKITIQSDKYKEFVEYLSCLRNALSKLLITQDGVATGS